ncbi:hypothetical protein LUZ60_012246 [Juncus effusus]|nr:hypothetical protein LUZ60_012246 [Juncus effusus]
MVRRASFSSFADNLLSEQPGDVADSQPDRLQWPFGQIDGLDRDDIREAAYEIFFAAPRSNATAKSKQLSHLMDNAGEGGGTKGGGLMVVNSRIKRTLGLRTRRAVQMTPLRPASGASKKDGKMPMRPMTSAELMRQQMAVSEQSDNRLRKALSRTLVNPQFVRRPELLILPLELLRHVTPNDFATVTEYNSWQRRQLKILEAGLATDPFHPLDRHSNPAALRLREVVRYGEVKQIDTDKKSDAMRMLTASVQALANRNPAGTPVDVPHWADGFPLNMHLYIALLRAIFDTRDETVVLDEVDELFELMKRAWVTLGMNGMIHNVCFTWVLMEQYVVTSQIEPDLLSAALAMLAEVAKDAKSMEREPGYIRVLSPVLASMQAWAERKLLDYHQWFQNSVAGIMENVLCLAYYTGRILSEDVSTPGCSGASGSSTQTVEFDPSTTAVGNRADCYIRSSIKNAFNKIYENGSGNIDSMVVEVEEDPCEILSQLAIQTEELANIEKETYSPVLRNWHPYPTAVAVVTLHNCFCSIFRQYVARMSGLTNEFIRVLNHAGRMEKKMVKMAKDNLTGSKDGGNSVVSEMIPFEVDSIIMNLIKGWMEDRLRIGRECVKRATETENWHPRSKDKKDAYAQSAAELMKVAKTTVDEFFEIQVDRAREELLQELADGIDKLVQDYASLVASVGVKEMPALPPLTRCNQDSKLLQLWKKAACQQPCQTPCQASIDMDQVGPPQPRLVASKSTRGRGETHHPRLTMSRATQRLYVRLNTLHYVLASLNSIDRSLTHFATRSNNRHNPSPSPAVAHLARRRALALPNFEQARDTIQSSILHVSEVAAFRLIFTDMSSVFYDALYVGNVAEVRVRPAVRALKQNLTFLTNVLIDRPVALREVMKASFDVFQLVLLAGGVSRAFLKADHQMIFEDLGSLKKLFCSIGVESVTEEVVEAEAAAADEVVSLMGLPAERLIEEFVRVAWEGYGPVGDEKMPIPPNPSRWARSDPNTILRVLCHRDEETANRFLKRTFDLPKRRGS